MHHLPARACRVAARNATSSRQRQRRRPILDLVSTSAPPPPPPQACGFSLVCSGIQFKFKTLARQSQAAEGEAHRLNSLLLRNVRHVAVAGASLGRRRTGSSPLGRRQVRRLSCAQGGAPFYFGNAAHLFGAGHVRERRVHYYPARAAPAEIEPAARRKRSPQIIIQFGRQSITISLAGASKEAAREERGASAEAHDVAAPFKTRQVRRRRRPDFG